ncbi:MAG: peptidylprolyl isomerase [Nocardioidaceae bacterium]|nr:peptidylprolyl isomerase [Nocardioidaceae bacterium]
MVSRQQRARRLARARAERQVARRQVAVRRRRRRTKVAGVVLVVALLVGGGVLAAQLVTDGESNAASAEQTQTTPPTQPTTQPPIEPVRARCDYRRDGPLAPGVRLPSSSIELAPAYSVSVNTNRGAIAMSLDAAAAPCTVNAFLQLARSGVLDGTACPLLRDSRAAGDYLACGDAAGPGAGDGSAGFTIPVENVAPGPHPAGTLLAAPGDGGNVSRFVLAAERVSFGGPRTVFGQVTSGLPVLVAITEAGVGGGDTQQSAVGPPAVRTVIRSVAVGQA